MKSNWLVKLSYWLGGGLIIAGVAYALFNNIKLAMKYCYKISKLKFVKISADKLIINLTILFKNYSTFNIIAKSYDLDIMLNGIKVAKVNQDHETVISSNGVSEIIVPVEGYPAIIGKNWKKLIDVLPTYFTAPEKINIEAKGNVIVKLLGLSVTLPIDIVMSVKDAMSDDPDADLRCANFIGDKI